MSEPRGGRQNGKGMKVINGVDVVVGGPRRGHPRADKDHSLADILAP